MFSDLSNIIYICATVTLLGFFSQYLWLGDLCAQFRPHVAAVTLLLFLPLLLLRKQQKGFKVFLAILSLCLVANLAPYLCVPTAQSAGPADKTTVSVLQYNIYSGNTMSEAETKLISTLDADIVCIEELSPQWQKNFEKLRSVYPSQFTHPRLDNFGLAILSKFQFIDTECFAAQNQVPTMAVQLSAPDGTRFLVLASHPEPPRADQAYKNREIVIKDIGKYIAQKKSQNPDMKVIWTGDFNAAAWSGQLANTLSRANLVEAKTLLPMPTWPAYAPLPLRIYLDHIFISKEIKMRSITMHESPGSDHNPLLAKLSL